MSGSIGIGYFGQDMPNSLADVYHASWQSDIAAVEKYKSGGTPGITTPGAFNAIYGPRMFNLAYNKHNTLAAIGAKAYFTGVRFQRDLSMSGDDAADAYTGVVRGGYRGKPQMGVYDTIEMPYVVNQHNFAMEFGMTAINGIDDVLKWEQQVDLESATWLSRMNQQILRSAYKDPVVGWGTNPDGSAGASKERVGLESIDRIISNSSEAAFLPGSASSLADGRGAFAVPYWQAVRLTSADGNPLIQFRDRDNAAFDAGSDNNYNSYVDHNYTNAETSEATLRQLSLPMIDMMFNTCMPYWDDNKTGGKVLITGYDTQTKMQAILQPQQRYINDTRAQMSVNGISTVEGQSTGFQVASYNGCPILPDKFAPKGYRGNEKAGVSNIYCIDTDTLSRGVLRAPVVSVSEDPLVVGSYNRVCNMYDISQVQCLGYRGNGKIIHLK